MALGIGIEYDPGSWKICLSENGQLIECQVFEQPATALVYIERLCTLYPEPLMVFTAPWETPFLSASEITDWSAVDGYPASRFLPEQADFLETLRTFSKVSSQTYCLPSLMYLQTIPPYRRSYRTDLGTSRSLSQVAYLLFRLREQGAGWGEMNFFFLEVNQFSWSITVIKEGRIVDGILPHVDFRGEDDQVGEAELALWEGLTRSLIGLKEIHQLEDIVLMGERSEAAMKRFEQSYQFYAFPAPPDEQNMMVAAHGASLLAEGLETHGLTAELVAWLKIQASDEDNQSSVSSVG
jgi:predicted butyrate kinase (DUF1464 family)